MSALDRAMRRALEAGRRAAADGAPPTSNPHRGTSRDPRERVLSVLWRRGYSSGHTTPVDYGGDE